MKQLTHAAIAFFVLFTVQAQTITEKDLLGTWNVTFINLKGTTIDFKTGEVKLSDEAAAEIEASGQDVEESRQGIIKEIEPIFNEIFLDFKPGLVMDFNAPGEKKNTTYTLKPDGEATLIVRSDGKELKITLKDGILNLSNPEADGTALSFERKK